MSTRFVVALIAAAVLMVVARVLASALPVRRLSRPTGITDAVITGTGMLGLVFHCTAMFGRGVVDWLPGSATPIADVRALGTASLVWYVIPATLILLGLRRQQPAALAVLALAMSAVAVTMFNKGALQPHLTAIFVFVTLLVAVTTMLTPVPSRRSRAAAA